MNLVLDDSIEFTKQVCRTFSNNIHFCVFILKASKLLDLNISPSENAEQDRDGCDQREQRGDAGGQGPHLEESLF